MSELFNAENETHLTVSRKSLGLIIGREIDYDEWMLISSLRGTSSFGIEKGTGNFPDNAHGEKPYDVCTINRDELKAYMAGSKKYLGNAEWNALTYAMHKSYQYEQDIEKEYTAASGRGSGMPGSHSEHLYNEWLASKEIKFKDPAEVIRDLLTEITIPPHFMGKYSS